MRFAFATTVTLVGVAAVAGFLTLTGRGSGTLFEGISDERIQVPLKLSDSDASPAIPSGQAMATAIREGASFRRGDPEVVQETVLLVMEETRPDLPKDRLVWAVHFDDPAAALGEGYRFIGPDGNILHEAEYAIALVDATTGEYILTMEGWKRLDVLPPGITPPAIPSTSQ